ncbi:MAG: GDSL-type esterase/lipase family protein [Solirubrobacterales bacterium]
MWLERGQNNMPAVIRSAVLAALLTAMLALPAPATSSAATLGRVVALGDSLASGQWLGPQVPGSIADCGQSTGGYPELAMARVSHGTWVNATCNATTTDNFTNGWTGPNGAAIPPQYNSINGNEDLVIVGSGNNEAFFGKIAYDCSGYQPAVDAFFHNRDYPQETPWAIPNHCTDTYLVNGVNQIPSYVAISKSKIAAALTKIHQLAPNAKILLVGKPRIFKPSGSQCFSSEVWLTATDAPLYATWEDGVRQAMIDDVNAFNSSVAGNYAHFVDMQGISGSSHTACETNWSDRWMNPHTYQSGLTYPGIALHNTPLGASVTANAIVDAIHAKGFDTGSVATNPVVSISSPTSGIVTTAATIPVSFTASDNIRVASCSITSGASVALSAGANTIVVTCFDDAGNSGSASVTVMRDANPPTISITAPVNGSGTTSATTQLNYTASDDVGTPNCTPASGSTIALSTGANTLTVTCTDSVGRTASSSVTVSRGTPPVVAISSPSEGANTQNASVNVAYTVNGVAEIPSGTTCKVGATTSSSATANSATLAVGANAIVVTCTNLFGSGSSSVTVNRGAAPVVVMTAPSNNLNTTAASANVGFTVDGAPSIPSGTTCTVGGAETISATTNPVPLQLGANTISVACTNQFGTGSGAVTVNRGDPPTVAIASPTDGLKTTAASVNVAYKVNGVQSIPAGTSCTVGGAASSSASANSVALAIGANTISVACSNAFGSGSARVGVSRGNPPVVAIASPADGMNTTAAQVNVTYKVNGVQSIPAGTNCTVGGVASSDASTNTVALAIGANTISVACSSDYGSASSAITVTRGVTPIVAIAAPVDGTLTSSASINVAFSLNGAASIPSGTTCTVRGAATSDPATNSVALATGSNTITVACSNVFGSDARSVTVVRGSGPTVAITAPSGGLSTTASAVNVAFTVNGTASIPNGTSCAVGGSPTSSATANSVPLALGANTLEVTCSNTLGDDTQSIVVYRGLPPEVTVIAPVDNLKLVASTINVSFTVDGAASIPNGTNCSVAGTPATSASTNNVSLSLGINALTVSCANPFGAASTTVHVERGTAPAVAITAPASGLKTNATAVNVAYTIGGSTSLPAGTSCTVGGAASTSGANNTFALAYGASTITVACSNAFASDSAQVTVVRGDAPTVTIISPADGLNTTASTSNVVYRIGGASSIPAGTTCTVNGASSTNPNTNTVALAKGANAIVVSCANDFGSESTSVTVNRGAAPSIAIAAPASGLNTTAASIDLTYTVDGLSTLAAGTSCIVGGAASSNPAANTIGLALGANVIVVSCANAFDVSSRSITVNRGNRPAVTITSPSDQLDTAAAGIDFAFTVDGAGAIPPGTTCSVAGDPVPATSSNSVVLGLGANSIEVSCTNAFGTDSDSVTVTRGNPPVVALSAPQDGSNTSRPAVDVSFTVDGTATIPAGTTCSVAGAATATASGTPVALALGANSISVTCTNAFGAGSESLSVVRVQAPAVSVVSPAGGSASNTPTTVVSFLVDGSAAIPDGTTCSIQGETAATTSGVSVALALGANTIEVSCVDEWGSVGAESVVVTYTAPVGDGETPPADPKLSALSTGKLRPLRSGPTFSTHKLHAAAKFKATLASATSVRLSVERLDRGHAARRVSAWTTIKLPAGRSTIYFSGRARGRALAPGRYRVRLIASGSDKTVAGNIFRITR